MALLVASASGTALAGSESLPPAPEALAAPDVAVRLAPDTALTPTRNVFAARAGTEPAVPGDRRWYGWQIALVDTAAWVLVFTRIEHPAAGLGVYAVGGPIVHAANGNLGRAAVSLALRIGLPALGYGCGRFWHEVTGDYWQSMALRFTVVGVLAAEIVDISILPRKDSGPTHNRPPAAFTLSPILLPSRHGGLAGLAGTF